MRARVVIPLFVLCFLAHSLPASAALTIAGYDPQRHERFLNDADFIGSGYDWSGVGRNESGRWGVLLSPSFTVSATHAAPAIGSTLRFYATNDLGGSFVERQVVASTAVTQSGQVNSSDLVLTQLSGPASGIMHYPVLSLPTLDDYVGQELFVWGQSSSDPAQYTMRLGRNEITAVLPTFSHPNLGSSIGDAFIYDYDTVNGVGDDEARVAGGDSGGPSFVIAAGGVPAVVGTHWFNYDGASVGVSQGSGDNLVPSFIDEMNSLMASSGSSERLTIISAVPEPSTLLLVTLAVGPLLFRREPRVA